MELFAGQGLSLSALYSTLYGSSKVGKAFRSIVKSVWDGATLPPELGEMATTAKILLSSSQELKIALNASGKDGPKLQWVTGPDPFFFFQRNIVELRELKKWMSLELGIAPVRFSKETSLFLKEWVNTNGYNLPRPTPDTIQELKPFRPTETRVYFRGMRFKDIGELVQFQETFGSTKKPFPFLRKRHSSWSTSKRIAERFGRYSADADQNSAMMSWLSRVRNQKDYSGYGGYVIGARVAPSQTLVDLSHPDLPFAGGKHGNEGEVIVKPDVALVAKVYLTFGDLEREVEDFLRRDSAYTPDNPSFWSYLGPIQVLSVEGDALSGTVTFGVSPAEWWSGSGVSNPRDSEYGADILQNFRRKLYRAEWADAFTVRYRRMR